MTTTAAEPSTAVGSTISTRQQLHDLPDQAVVRDVDRNREYIKRHGQFYNERSKANHPAEWFSLSGRYVIDHIPQVPSESEAPTNEKPPAEEPMDYDTSDEVTGSALTLARYAQRIRTTLISVAVRRLENDGSAQRVLQEAQCPEFPLSPGMAVGAHDRGLIASLPEGTTMSVGTEGQGDYGLFGKQTRDNMVRLAGSGVINDRRYGQCYTVESIPGIEPQPWYTQAPSDSEVDQIRDFQRRIWRAGRNEKDRHGWCGEYESLMQSEAGLNEHVERNRDGRYLLPDAVRALREGAILRHQNTAGSVLVVRDNTSRNPCRTSRLGGSIGGSWSSHSLEVVFDPNTTTQEELRIRCASPEEMDAMPEGTYITDGSRRYRKRGVGGSTRWAYQRHGRDYDDRYCSQDFNYHYLFYCGFPQQGEEQAHVDTF